LTVGKPIPIALQAAAELHA